MWSSAPDGKKLAAGFRGELAGVNVWDVATREPFPDKEFIESDVDVRSVAFSRDGNMLAVGYGGGEREEVIITDPDVVKDEPDGRESGVVLWDVAKWKPLPDSPLRVKRAVFEVWRSAPTERPSPRDTASELATATTQVVWFDGTWSRGNGSRRNRSS